MQAKEAQTPEQRRREEESKLREGAKADHEELHQRLVAQQRKIEEDRKRVEEEHSRQEQELRRRALELEIRRTHEEEERQKAEAVNKKLEAELQQKDAEVTARLEEERRRIEAQAQQQIRERESRRVRRPLALGAAFAQVHLLHLVPGDLGQMHGGFFFLADAAQHNAV